MAKPTWWTAHLDDYDTFMRQYPRVSWDAATAWNRLGSGARFSRIRLTIRFGATRRWTRSWPANRSKSLSCWYTACGTGRHLWRHGCLQGSQAEGYGQR